MEKKLQKWAQENDRLYARAIDALAQYIIEDLGIVTQDDYDDGEIEKCAHQWQEYLDDDLKEALQDRVAIAMVVDKNYLGGGGYEIKRDIQIDTRKRIKEIINQ